MRRDVTIVVVAHNERATLRPTVEHLVETTSGSAVEVVVVDDASTDGGADFARDSDSRVTLVRSESRLGISRARNLGARSGSGEVVVFSDAHVRPDRGWLEPLLDELADEACGEVAPAVGHLESSDRDGYGFTWRGPDLTMKWLTQAPRRPVAVPFICGCFLALRRDVFDVVGGFDEGLVLWGSEDAELSLRLWRLGWECRVVPQARIAHLFRQVFPYAIDWEPIVHNTLRMATVHLESRGLARVVRHYAGNRRFAAATAHLASGDTWSRRSAVAAQSSVPTSTVLARFGIEAVA